MTHNEIIILMGVFTKNEREYRFTSKNFLWGLLLILLLSVGSIRRKLLKTNHIQIQKVAILYSDRMKINLIPNKLFRYFRFLKN